jgi:hypothetical protein
MARADVDLDDPVKGGDGAASNSADDLLAQLAGDEVERMLSEADAAAPEALNVDRAVPESGAGGSGSINSKSKTADAGVDGAASGSDVFRATEAALDGLFDELDGADAARLSGAEKGVSKSGAVTGSGESDAPTGDKQSIEEVITQRAQTLIEQAQIEAEADSAALATDPALSTTGEPLSAASELAAEMDADEREHMEALRRMKAGEKLDDAPVQASFAKPTEPVPQPEVEATPAEIDEASVDFSPPDKSDRVPLLVRVLEWINAPLAGLSDGVRMAIGKVAIVTMFNAIGVFVYVMLFRRH